MNTGTAIFGLVLAGGRSRRMNTDKAALFVDGYSQLERSVNLLKRVCDEVFVSVRNDQGDDPLRSRYPLIIDRFDDAGPLAGILSAQLDHPERTWLVVACDLPLLDEESLRFLIRNRDATKFATAYRSSTDELPEPLCAIYEPHSHKSLVESLEQNRFCPRKILINSDIELLQQPNADALDNMNTPEDLERVVANGKLIGGGKTITVQYFAFFREQAGCSEESMSIAAQTTGDLFAHLCDSGRLPGGLRNCKVAVNDVMSDWQHPLADGDRVLLFPPVAGG
jgi:molybdopterin-guanine dinucleotide biosynthesis protein A